MADSTSAIEQLKALRNRRDPYDIPEADIRTLQIAAAQEDFQKKRAEIPALDKRAKEVGVDAIRSLDDMPPLLFAHTNYKSYPASFISQGKWRQLLQWLSLISNQRYADVDLEGVQDIDDFLARLWARKYYITTSSGTGGKLSLMPRSQSDMDWYRSFLYYHRDIIRKIQPENQFHFFCFGGTQGTYTTTYSNQMLIDGYARPESRFVLIDEPLRNATLMRMAEMRKRMAEGRVTPDEIADFERDSVEQGKRMQDRFNWMAEKLFELRGEKVWISAMTAQMWDLMRFARDRGLTRADLAPGSVVTGGGGRKHLKLPDDFQEQLNAFFGMDGPGGYGMSEMSWSYPACEAKRYHANPFAAALILDEAGQKLLPREGQVTGRFAFLDPTFEYRWGGLISGDKVTADFGPCPCGRKGMTILDPIRRFSDLTGKDDKIECAGTIDAYIRGGFTAEPA